MGLNTGGSMDRPCGPAGGAVVVRPVEREWRPPEEVDRMLHWQDRGATRARGLGGLMTAGLVIGALSVPAIAAAQSPAADEPLELAYLSFAVANTYDAPMLEAAQAAAAAGNATLT